jgi:uncharacterized protein (DUF362 family)
MIGNSTVAIVREDTLVYPRQAPFHPSTAHPEYPFDEIGEPNPVYDAVRELLRTLGLDREHYGKSEWNPLGDLIRPGQTVLIKPNFVIHFNPAGSLDCLFTHGSVVRAVLDYVYIALRGQGSITLGDAPLQSADFGKIVEINGIDRIAEFYLQKTDLGLDVVDLRLSTVNKRDSGLLDRRNLHGDHSGYCAVDLGRDSALCDLDGEHKRYRVTNYDKSEMTRHHNPGRHEYLISNSVLSADVIVNRPKLKTHRKVGMTCALKNLVGLNGCKDWLPHHRYGSVEEGGDEYLHRSLHKRIATRLCEMRDVARDDRAARLVTYLLKWVHRTSRFFRFGDPYREGSWYGNDTLPRTLADLNRIALYADKNGVMRDEPQRGAFIVVDAIVAGEREGPVDPSPKHCGILVAGSNPVCVDLACSRIMGFDPGKIPTFTHVQGLERYPICSGLTGDIEIRSERCRRFSEIGNAYGMTFIPALGWQGHVEEISPHRSSES